MLVTFISTVFCSAAGGLFAYVTYLVDVYFFKSGTRAPTGLDYLIIFGLVIIPILGAVLGFALGQNLRSEGKGAVVFFTSSYVLIPVAILVLLGALCVLNVAIAKRNATPAAQNVALTAQLAGTVWTRQASDAQLQMLAKSAPQQITKLSFAKTAGGACANGEAYTATYVSGTSVEGCWSIADGTNTLSLGTSDLVDYYQNVRINSNMLLFESAGQTWSFTKTI